MIWITLHANGRLLPELCQYPNSTPQNTWNSLINCCTILCGIKLDAGKFCYISMDKLNFLRTHTSVATSCNELETTAAVSQYCLCTSFYIYIFLTAFNPLYNHSHLGFLLSNILVKIPALGQCFWRERSHVVNARLSPSEYRPQGGRTRLPKFKFSAKFPIGLYVILQIQIRKFKNDCYIMWKIILTENPSRLTLNPCWNNVKWILFVNYTVIRMLYM